MKKDTVILKNISDAPFTFEVTGNPMSAEPQFSIRENAGLALPQDMEVNESQQYTQKEYIERSVKRQPQLKERLSALVAITFGPGEEIKFGRGSKYNLNQAEYIYKSFGGYADDPYGNEMTQPVIELTADGMEDKGNFYPKYRMRKAINVMQQPYAPREQFNLPHTQEKKADAAQTA